MTPADRRITELIEKWLTSIDLHLKYVELGDAAYARAEQWPKHDRPTRWVLEVARQKILELKGHIESRQAMGDGKFAESLELMAFLANLVGIQHIQRFIPLADGTEPPAVSNTQTVEMPITTRATARAKPASDESTREMPRLKAAPQAASKSAATPRSEPGKQAAKPATKSAESKNSPTDLKGKIIADAVRLLKWGKPWHELAELIARIADRPSEGDIRKVLRTHKNEIESRAAADVSR